MVLYMVLPLLAIAAFCDVLPSLVNTTYNTTTGTTYVPLLVRHTYHYWYDIRTTTGTTYVPLLVQHRHHYWYTIYTTTGTTYVPLLVQHSGTT